MSLSNEQKKDLNQLGEYFRQIEKIAIENNIDLDVFMSQYTDNGFAVYATEKVSLSEKAEKRKTVFQKTQKEKPTKSSVKSH
ncbi:MAG: hypothetical protein KBF60_12090 [Ignavibacteriaceae bacterium]|nr:hypothetical protein [Ignavibacteriaceae bacterium]